MVATKQGSITFKREFFYRKGRFLFKKVVFKRVIFDLICIRIARGHGSGQREGQREETGGAASCKEEAI